MFSLPSSFHSVVHTWTNYIQTRSIPATMKLFLAITFAFAALVAAAPGNDAKEAVNKRLVR